MRSIFLAIFLLLSISAVTIGFTQNGTMQNTDSQANETLLLQLDIANKFHNTILSEISSEGYELRYQGQLTRRSSRGLEPHLPGDTWTIFDGEDVVRFGFQKEKHGELSLTRKEGHEEANCTISKKQISFWFSTDNDELAETLNSIGDEDN